MAYTALKKPAEMEKGSLVILEFKRVSDATDQRAKQSRVTVRLAQDRPERDSVTTRGAEGLERMK